MCADLVLQVRPHQDSYSTIWFPPTQCKSEKQLTRFAGCLKTTENFTFLNENEQPQDTHSQTSEGHSILTWCPIHRGRMPAGQDKQGNRLRMVETRDLPAGVKTPAG